MHIQCNSTKEEKALKRGFDIRIVLDHFLESSKDTLNINGGASPEQSILGNK